jgi:hypothetical protein
LGAVEGFVYELSRVRFLRIESSRSISAEDVLEVILVGGLNFFEEQMT